MVNEGRGIMFLTFYPVGKFLSVLIEEKDQ